jgi:ribosomal protein L29
MEMLEEELEKPKKEIRQLNRQWGETKAAVVEFRFTEAVDSVDAAAKVAKEVRKNMYQNQNQNQYKADKSYHLG